MFATSILLLPDFALILLGFALRRLLQLGDHFWTGAERLVYYVLFPALLFNAVLRTRIDWLAAAPLLMTAAAVLASGMLLGLLGRVVLKLTPRTFASVFQCAFRYNSYIGLAVAGKLYGADGIAVMGILVGAMVPPANVAAVWMLARHGDAALWRELARNPLIVATLAGLLGNVAGLELPAPLAQFLGRLGEAAIALGLLAVGAALKLHGREALGVARAGTAWFLAVKLLALPLVAWGSARWFGLSGLYRDVVLVFAALPTASSAYILAVRMGGDGPSTAWLVSTSTLAAMLTLPLWLSVW
jgi:malonate transporter